MVSKLIEEILFSCSMLHIGLQEIVMSEDMEKLFSDEIQKTMGRPVSGVAKYKGIPISVDKTMQVGSFTIKTKR